MQAFGAQVFEVIERTPERLREIHGIGDKRASRIIGGWADQVIREIMVFLHARGVSTSRAVRIFKTYGADAIEIVRADPYRVARDIRGIGSLSADTPSRRRSASPATRRCGRAPACRMRWPKLQPRATAGRRAPSSCPWR